MAELGGGTLRVTVPLDGPPEYIRKAIEERKKQKAQVAHAQGEKKGAGGGSEGASAKGKTRDEQRDIVVGKGGDGAAHGASGEHGGQWVRGRRKYVFQNKAKDDLSSVSQSKHNATKKVATAGEDAIPKSIKTSKSKHLLNSSSTDKEHRTVTLNSSVVPIIKNTPERPHSRRKMEVTAGAVPVMSAVLSTSDSVTSGEGKGEELGGSGQEAKKLGAESESLGDSENEGLSILSGGRRGARGHDDKEQEKKKKPDKGARINIHQDRSSGDGGASLARVPKEGSGTDDQEVMTTIAPRGREEGKERGHEDGRSNSERKRQNNRNKKKPARRKSSLEQPRNAGGDEARPPGRGTPAQPPAAASANGDTQNPEDEKRLESSGRVDLGSNGDIRGVEPGSSADQPGSRRITNAGSAEASDGLGDDATPKSTLQFWPQRSSTPSPREEKRVRSRGKKARAKTRPRKMPTTERALLSADAVDDESESPAPVQEANTGGDSGGLRQHLQEKEDSAIDKIERHKNSRVRNDKTKKRKRRKRPKASHSRKRRKHRNGENGITAKDRATSVPDDTQKTRTDRERIADTAGDEDENPGDISPANRGETTSSRNSSRDESGAEVQENGASLPGEEWRGGNKQTAAERPSSGALFSGDRERPTKGGGGPNRRRGKNQSRSTSPSNRKRQSKKRPPPLPPSENTGVGPPPQERLSARNAANPSAAGNRDGNLGAETGDFAATTSKQNSSGSRRRHRHRHSRYNRQRRYRHRLADARREGGRKRGVRGAGGKVLTSHRPRDYSLARKSGLARRINHERGRRDLIDPFRADEDLQETRNLGFSSSLWKRPPLIATNPYAAVFGGEEKLNRIVWNSPESTTTRDSLIQGSLESPEMSRAAMQRDARRARRQLRRAAAHSQETLITGLSAEQDIMLSPAETDLRRIDILSRDCDHVRGSGGGQSAADAALDSTKQITDGKKPGKSVLSFGDPAKKSSDGDEAERDDAKEQRTRRELRNLFGAPNITYRCSPFHKHWLFTSRWVAPGIFNI